ncbi:Uncharacterised protein [Mycobacteroides abscessus subsp. abscessus]|nr:Uncharacterised protein [Mycobacteroides abscessus subsp. abscessus]
MNPLNSIFPILTTALYRDTVAIDPLSKNLNGARSAGLRPLSSALICLAA